MKSLIAALIYKLAKAYFDTGVFARVEKAVRGLLSSDLEGDAKRNLVREAVRKEYDTARTTVIDTIIQVVLLKLKKSS